MVHIDNYKVTAWTEAKVLNNGLNNTYWKLTNSNILDFGLIKKLVNHSTNYKCTQ